MRVMQTRTRKVAVAAFLAAAFGSSVRSPSETLEPSAETQRAASAPAPQAKMSLDFDLVAVVRFILERPDSATVWVSRFTLVP